MRIILLGPPGAGKGTQAKALAQKLNLLHISTGDILRQSVLGGSDLGKEVSSFMDKGALVPDALVSQMLMHRLNQSDARDGFILDGYPRNIKQAKMLDLMLKQRNMNIDLVVYLDTSESVIIQRLSGRLVCESCGANFHIKNMPPKTEGICNNCGARLYQRTDDKKETIKTRLEVYEKENSSLIKYYQQRHKLCRIRADEEADIVLNKIVDAVLKYNDSPKV